MPVWDRALVSLCGVGVLKEINFWRAFEYHNITSDPFNLTQDQLQFEVHPVFSYSYVCILLVVFLTADILAYKPVIALGVLGLVSAVVLYMWGRGPLAAQMGMFSLALGSATDLAYFAYAFAVVETEHFPKAAGLPRAALLVGKLIGIGSGEISVCLFDTDYVVLQYVTLGLLGMALLVSIFLPSATLSAFQRVIERELKTPEDGRFHSQTSMQGSTCSMQINQGQTTPVKMSASPSVPRPPGEHLSSSQDSMLAHPAAPMFYDIDTSSLGFIYNDMLSESADMSSLDRTRLENSVTVQPAQQTPLKEQESLSEMLIISVNSVKETITNQSVIVWTVYWIVVTMTNALVGTSITPLLNSKYPHRNAFMLDGVVESVSLFAGAVLVLVISFVKVTWANVDALFLGITSLVFCVLLGLMSAMDSLWLTYSLYVVCRVLYQLTITAAMWRVAMFVRGRRFATVFGLNMLVAAILVVVFTGSTAADRNSGFPLVAQIAVYSGIMGVCSLVLLARSFHVCVSNRFLQNRSESCDDLDTLIQS